MTGSRDEAWEKLKSGDQGHARRSCNGAMEVEDTIIREGNGLSYMAYRRCTVLEMTLDMIVEVRGSEDGQQVRGIARKKYAEKIRWPAVLMLIRV